MTSLAISRPDVLQPQRVAWRDGPVMPALCAVTLAAAALINAMDVGDSSRPGGETVGLSGQVAAKLAVAAAAGALGLWGLWHSQRLRRCMARVPSVLLCLLGGTFVATSVVAVPQTARVSQVAALVLISYIVFLPTALYLLGLWRTVASLLVGLTLFLLGSWLLYLLVPSLGVFVEHLGQDRIVRMGGLGHPNALGRAAMLSVLLALALLRRADRGRGLLGLVAVLGLATALAAMSRTALVAGGMALAVLVLHWLPMRRVVVGGMAAAVVVLGAFLCMQLIHAEQPLVEQLLLAGTKSGEVEELTSATGRTEIWQAAWQWIRQRPLTGYGLGSAPVLLTDHSQHTHNILLHPLLSAGVVAVVLVATLLLWNLCAAVDSAEPLVRGIVAFILVSGAFEDTLLDTFPAPPTLLWLVATFYPVLAAMRAADAAPAASADAGRRIAAGRGVEGIGADGYTEAVT